MKQAQFNKLKSTKKIQLEANIGTLFRKSIKPKIGLNLDRLDGIINIDFDNNTIDVGAKTTFHNITLITLPYNLMPQIVPELSSITVGGAISGIGVESSSFRHGFVHNTVLEMDKCFYSDTYFTKDQFHKCMNMEQYNKIKSKYDEHNLFQNIYDKVITKT